jgi:hypothetical protein
MGNTCRIVAGKGGVLTFYRKWNQKKILLSESLKLAIGIQKQPLIHRE